MAEKMRDTRREGVPPLEAMVRGSKFGKSICNSIPFSINMRNVKLHSVHFESTSLPFSEQEPGRIKVLVINTLNSGLKIHFNP